MFEATTFTEGWSAPQRDRQRSIQLRFTRHRAWRKTGRVQGGALIERARSLALQRPRRPALGFIESEEERARRGRLASSLSVCQSKRRDKTPGEEDAQAGRLTQSGDACHRLESLRAPAHRGHPRTRARTRRRRSKRQVGARNPKPHLLKTRTPAGTRGAAVAQWPGPRLSPPRGGERRTRDPAPEVRGGKAQFFFFLVCLFFFFAALPDRLNWSLSPFFPSFVLFSNCVENFLKKIDPPLHF